MYAAVQYLSTVFLAADGHFQCDVAVILFSHGWTLSHILYLFEQI